MTHVGPAPVSARGVGDAPGNTSFVEWSAVLAGAVLAAAISVVLLAFGAAIGLSATSPWPNSGLSAKVIASLAVFWAMVQQIGAFMAGGYVAGRMRSRWHETTEHEVEFRDGLHGALVWAVGVVIGAVLLLTTAGAVARTGAEVSGQIAGAAAASTNNPLDLVIDTMLRPATATVAQATPPASPSATGPAPGTGPRARSPAMAGDESRAEVARILASSVAGKTLPAQDRAYLAQLVAQRTGLPQPEAERRVSDAINAAREATDKARRAAILTGFVTAASLLIALGAAWWSAQKGGNHRDNAVPARFNIRRRSEPMLRG